MFHARLTGANQQDVTQLLPLVNDVTAIAEKVGASRYRFDSLYADRAYDSNPDHEAQNKGSYLSRAYFKTVSRDYQ